MRQLAPAALVLVAALPIELACSTPSDTGVGGSGPDGVGGTSGGTGGEAATPSDIVVACVKSFSCATEPPDDAYYDCPLVGPSRCVDAFARIGWDDAPALDLPRPSSTDAVAQCTSSPGCSPSCVVASFACAKCTPDWGLYGPEGPQYCGEIPEAGGYCCPDPCPGSAPIVCEGTTVSYCAAAPGLLPGQTTGWVRYAQYDCGASDRICGGDDPNEPCKGKGPPCEQGMPTMCEGSIATYCSDGRLATFDCSTTKYRSACAGGATSGPPCRPKGSECWPPSDSSLGCDGEAVVVCIDGYRVLVSCTALGFASCAGGRCVE